MRYAGSAGEGETLDEAELVKIHEELNVGNAWIEVG